MAAVRATRGEAGEADMPDKLYERSVSFYAEAVAVADPGGRLRSPRCRAPTPTSSPTSSPSSPSTSTTTAPRSPRRPAGSPRAAGHDRVGTSTLTLAGLVNHAALNEDHWFGVVLLGRPQAEPWASAPWDDDPDWEFRTALDLEPAALLDRYERDVRAQPRQRRRRPPPPAGSTTCPPPTRGATSGSTSAGSCSTCSRRPPGTTATPTCCARRPTARPASEPGPSGLTRGERLSRMAFKAWHIPVRLATGAYILNSGPAEAGRRRRDGEGPPRLRHHGVPRVPGHPAREVRVDAVDRRDRGRRTAADPDRADRGRRPGADHVRRPARPALPQRARRARGGQPPADPAGHRRCPRTCGCWPSAPPSPSTASPTAARSAARPRPSANGD